MLRLTRGEFEAVVRRAVGELPAFFQEHLENVAVVVEWRPSPSLLREMGMDPREDTLFGLYQGMPLTERSVDDLGGLPDKISIYMEPLLEACSSMRELREEIQTTVVHEFAHYFGIEEDRLEDLGWD
jgi:predicted Zn-dependent protease with MMP-like domain